MAIYYYFSGITPANKNWQELKETLNDDLKGKRGKITFIGRIGNKAKSKTYRNGASKKLKELGINMQEGTLLWNDMDSSEMTKQMLKQRMTEDEMIETILESDIVYILGGDPIDQINYLKNNKLDGILRSYEGIVIGSSSGLMVMSKKIIIPPHNTGYKTYHESQIVDGLALTNLSIFPHFTYALNQKTLDDNIEVADLVEISYSHELLALQDESILRCSGDKVNIFGEQPYLLSNGNIKEKVDEAQVKRLLRKQ